MYNQDMTNTVYLLRHCDYDNPRNILPGRLPVSLSGKGISQANQLAKYFADKNIAAIYSSAVERCKQTAEIISQNQIPVIFDKRILETFSAYQGYWEDNLHEEGYHFFSHIPELGGENLKDIEVRVSNFWEEILPKTTGNIIICSHGDPLQVLYSHIHGLPTVDDNEVEANIPGWMEKGEFIELTLENGKLTNTQKPKNIFTKSE